MKCVLLINNMCIRHALSKMIFLWLLNRYTFSSICCTYLLRTYAITRKKDTTKFERLSNTHTRDAHNTQKLTFRVFLPTNKIIIYNNIFFTCFSCIHTIHYNITIPFHQPTCIFPLIVLRVNTNIYSLILLRKQLFLNCWRIPSFSVNCWVDVVARGFF